MKRCSSMYFLFLYYPYIFFQFFLGGGVVFQIFLKLYKNNYGYIMLFISVLNRLQCNVYCHGYIPSTFIICRNDICILVYIQVIIITWCMLWWPALSPNRPHPHSNKVWICMVVCLPPEFCGIFQGFLKNTCTCVTRFFKSQTRD